jgi:hypothetical protein
VSRFNRKARYPVRRNINKRKDGWFNRTKADGKKTMRLFRPYILSFQPRIDISNGLDQVVARFRRPSLTLLIRPWKFSGRAS